MRNIAYLAALLISGAAQGQTVGVHVASVHSKENSQFNNDNWGAYIQKDGWLGGIYRNSIHRNTFYAGRTIEYGPFALAGGLMTGYQKKSGIGYTRGAVGGFLAISAFTPEIAGVRAKITYIPARLVKSPDVLNLAIEKKF